jgi:hypothetical protein
MISFLTTRSGYIVFVNQTNIPIFFKILTYSQKSSKNHHSPIFSNFKAKGDGVIKED